MYKKIILLLLLQVTFQNETDDLIFKDILSPYCFKIQPLKKIYYQNKGVIGKSQNEVVALEQNKVVKIVKMKIGNNKKQFAEKVLENLMEIVTMKDIESSILKNQQKLQDLPNNFHKIENCYYDNDIQNQQLTFYLEQNLLSGNLDLAINFGNGLQNMPFCWLVETWISLLKNLELIHRVGFAHFDVKGSNVSFINKDPFKPIFIDFQYSKKISQEEYMEENQRKGYFVQIDQIMGTTHHIAQEIWTNNYYGFQSDYYSFGVMILKSLGFMMNDFLDQNGQNVVISAQLVQNLIHQHTQRILRFFPQNTNANQIRQIVQDITNLIQNLIGSQNRYYYSETLNALNQIKSLNENLNLQGLFNCQNRNSIMQVFVNKMRGK